MRKSFGVIASLLGLYSTRGKGICLDGSCKFTVRLQETGQRSHLPDSSRAHLERQRTDFTKDIKRACRTRQMHTQRPAKPEQIITYLVLLILYIDVVLSDCRLCLWKMHPEFAAEAACAVHTKLKRVQIHVTEMLT